MAPPPLTIIFFCSLTTFSSCLFSMEVKLVARASTLFMSSRPQEFSCLQKTPGELFTGIHSPSEVCSENIRFLPYLVQLNSGTKYQHKHKGSFPITSYRTQLYGEAARKKHIIMRPLCRNIELDSMGQSCAPYDVDRVL